MSNEVKKIGVFDWILFVVSVIYTISPIDIIPDILPGIGWIDDIVFLITSGLNLISKKVGETNLFLYSILKIIKFIFLFLGIIIVLLLLIFGSVIVGLINKL
jgi:hypothetical protein